MNDRPLAQKSTKEMKTEQENMLCVAKCEQETMLPSELMNQLSIGLLNETFLEQKK